MEEFRVLIKHTNKAVAHMTAYFTMLGIDVHDLRESDVQHCETNEKMAEVYVLCCRGTINAYLMLKNMKNFNEMMYEGVKTLV